MAKDSTRERDYLNAKEMAKALGISRASLYVYLQSGRIPPPDRHEITNLPRWRIEDVPQLRDLLRNGEAQAQ